MIPMLNTPIPDYSDQVNSVHYLQFFSTSIPHSAPAESHASLKSMLKLRHVELRRSRDFPWLATASALLGFCIALKKSGTGVEGSAADDKRHCLRMHDGKVVEETEHRLVRARVRVGSAGAMEVDPFD